MVWPRTPYLLVTPLQVRFICLIKILLVHSTFSTLVIWKDWCSFRTVLFVIRVTTVFFSVGSVCCLHLTHESVISTRPSRARYNLLFLDMSTQTTPIGATGGHFRVFVPLFVFPSRFHNRTPSLSLHTSTANFVSYFESFGFLNAEKGSIVPRSGMLGGYLSCLPLITRFGSIDNRRALLLLKTFVVDQYILNRWYTNPF